MEEGCLGRVTIRITMVGRIIRTKGEDSLVNSTNSKISFRFPKLAP